MRRNQIDPPGREDENVKIFPSGDQRGLDAPNAGVVNRTGTASPSVETNQTSLWRQFSSSIIRVRTKATLSPLGEMAGEPTVSML